MSRIVVAEDDRAIARLIKFKLERGGYQVDVAEDGAQAVEAVNKAHPDLVLLDVMMPVLNGYQVLKKIKEDQGLRDIPVIMLTARGQEKDIVKGIEMGSLDYIVKPFRPAELLARVNRVIKR